MDKPSTPDNGALRLASELMDAARTGDWEQLELLSAGLPDLAPPSTCEDQTQYLLALHAAIISAKIARADLLKSLHRLTAASGFNHSAD